jgi:uncharacterized protein
MIYRRLGRTEKMVSILGVGGGYVMLRDLDDAISIYQRAAELGVNYFDGRYGASSTMQRPVINQNRGGFVVGTKTASHTYQATWKRIEEDLDELGSDYLDIFYLRTYNHEMLEAHLAPGGSMEACVEARKQGKIHAIGLAGHSDLTALSRGVETGLVDVVQFPLNVVRREALDIVVPVCQKYDAGMVIMKPMNVGLVPAEVCLPWLANQPVHVLNAGMSTLEHLELDVAILDRNPMDLTPAEEAEAEYWREKKDKETCRICDRVCQVVCEPGLKIDWLLYHNIFQNELRRLEVKGFLEYPFAPWVKEQAETTFSNTLAELNACNNCGKCLEVCPYGLPITDLITRMKTQQAELVEELRNSHWEEEYQDSTSPLPKSVLASWASGGKKKS